MERSLDALRQIVIKVLSYENTSIFIVGGSDELTKSIVLANKTTTIIDCCIDVRPDHLKIVD
jgi:hypothetical protein